MASKRRPPATRAAEARVPRWGAQLRRGELYRVRHPSGDAKRSRVVVVVSRSAHLASRFSTAICAPVYSQRGGLSSEVEVGPAEGLKHASAILCDVLTSFARGQLTDYVGTLGPAKLAALRTALRIALEIE
ncbi:MAG: type II toxin-antitoxin system PemK/MazF family toxin [Deltaproteobacteria bacterium]|nr:MAG: type II toxin-antitoxin system PemK/MazF family toxin [Deltaproteobacteria bacterium]